MHPLFPNNSDFSREFARHGLFHFIPNLMERYEKTVENCLSCARVCVDAWEDRVRAGERENTYFIMVVRVHGHAQESLGRL